ncbi:hypothetical protein [Variovorax sp. MHTC-1]|uniref:hypothetical protein n=1 Tax=Variovorax sp. MHTC-1 TaxID=2495593 RepID=UPI000F8750C5|nr:hypothetical protein [Variovorax sp. MHTC-1]RST55956.1 hypothetical protein EJI01_04120 [Variovorax sp. MHTC-1]
MVKVHRTIAFITTPHAPIDDAQRVFAEVVAEGLHRRARRHRAADLLALIVQPAGAGSTKLSPAPSVSTSAAIVGAPLTVAGSVYAMVAPGDTAAPEAGTALFTVAIAQTLMFAVDVLFPAETKECCAPENLNCVALHHDGRTFLKARTPSRMNRETRAAGLQKGQRFQKEQIDRRRNALRSVSGCGWCGERVVATEWPRQFIRIDSGQEVVLASYFTLLVHFTCWTAL